MQIERARQARIAAGIEDEGDGESEEEDEEARALQRDENEVTENHVLLVKCHMLGQGPLYVREYVRGCLTVCIVCLQGHTIRAVLYLADLIEGQHSLNSTRLLCYAADDLLLSQVWLKQDQNMQHDVDTFAPSY